MRSKPNQRKSKARKASPLTSREKVRAHRVRLRAQGGGGLRRGCPSRACPKSRRASIGSVQSPYRVLTEVGSAAVVTAVLFRQQAIGLARFPRGETGRARVGHPQRDRPQALRAQAHTVGAHLFTRRSRAFVSLRCLASCAGSASTRTGAVLVTGNLMCFGLYPASRDWLNPDHEHCPRHHLRPLLRPWAGGDRGGAHFRARAPATRSKR